MGEVLQTGLAEQLGNLPVWCEVMFKHQRFRDKIFCADVFYDGKDLIRPEFHLDSEIVGIRRVRRSG